MRPHFLLEFLIFLILSIEINLVSKVNCDSLDSKNDNFCNGNYIIISTIDGVITALDVDTGQKCWSFLLDPEKFFSSSLDQVELWKNDQRVFLVPSLDGSLYQYDGLKKEIQPFPVDVDSFISQSDPSTSLIGGKIKIIYGIHRLTGEVIYKCKIDGCETIDMPFPENIIMVEEIIHCVNAIDPVKALKKWHFRVVELKMKLAFQVYNENSSFQNINENALIPRTFKDISDLNLYKVSLRNRFAAMINKSSEDFLWLYKATCPITDAWYLRDDMLKSLDPFGKESRFFTIDMDSGQLFVHLFLGVYQNQLYIKKSKAFRIRDMSLSLPGNVLYQSLELPVCSIPDSAISVIDSPAKGEDMTLTHKDYNVSDYGYFFYANYSIAENATQCYVNTTNYIIYHDYSIPLSYRVIMFFSGCVILFIVMHAIFHFVCLKEFIPSHCSVSEVSLNKTEKPEFRSRFHQDFELISILGKGGFGVVMDAKNKIDDCRYAVKRICLSDQLDDDQYEKVLREVKALAKLDHHGIVRYFNAWIEYPPLGWQEKKDIESNIIDITESFSSDHLEITSESEPVAAATDSLAQSFFKKIDQNPLKPFGDIFDTIQPEDAHSEFSGDYEISGNSSDDSDSCVEFSKSDHSAISSNKDNSFEEYSDDNSVVFEDNSKKINLKTYSTDSNKENSSDDDSVVFEDSNKWNLGICTDDNNTNSNDNDEGNLKNYKNSSYNDLNGFWETKEFVKNNENFEQNNSPVETSLLLVQHLKDDENKESYNNSLEIVHRANNILVSSKSEYIASARITDSSELLLHQNIDKKNKIEKKLRDTPKRTILHLSKPHTDSASTENTDCSESYVLKQTHQYDDMEKKLRNSSKRNILHSCKLHTKSVPKTFRGYLYIQMQLCQKESLRDWLDENTGNREYNKVMEIFYEIVDAVHYVHDRGLMHRDLKPSNIYFSMEGAIKIGDFGLATSSEIESENISDSQQLSNNHTSAIGTEFYMSPEQKRKQDYDYKTDIYSLGIIFFELMVPFQTGLERCKVLSRVRRLKFPEEFKETYKNESELVQQLLHEDPKCRPTTSEIKQHPLLSKYTSVHK